jgi:GH15 family glucan-1,4-alpha-glucosidase
MEADIFLDNNTDVNKVNTFENGLAVTPGLWMDGKMYWLKDSHEKIIPEEGISVLVKEGSIHSKTKLHDVFIKNHGDHARNVKLLFMHHYPDVTKELLAFVSPAEKIIFHIKNNQIYLVNGQCQGCSMEQMTVQPLWNVNTALIWQSLEKGVLKYQPMAKGIMVSIFSLDAQVKVNETCKASTWTVFGQNKNELLKLNQVMKRIL